MTFTLCVNEFADLALDRSAALAPQVQQPEWAAFMTHRSQADMFSSSDSSSVLQQGRETTVPALKEHLISS